MIGGCYTILGGLKAITISDVIQGIGMLAGGLLLTYYGFHYLGGGDVVAGIHRVIGDKREHLNAIGGAHSVLPFSTLFTGMLLINVYYWGMEQYIVQEALASRDLKTSQKGIALACAGKLIAPLLLNVPGLMAVHLYTSMKNPVNVFPRLVSDVMPPVFAGFMAAVVFGGALSTFNAGLNSIGTLFTINVYEPLASRRGGVPDERAIVRGGRIFQVVVVVGCIILSPYIIYFSGGFYNYLQKAASYFSVPIFTVMTVGLLTRRTPAIAARAGLIFFVISYMLTQFVFPTGLHYLHVLAILFVITVAGMLLIGKVFPRKEAFRLTDHSSVGLQPWKNRYWYFSLLIILMISMFILFSPLGLAK